MGILIDSSVLIDYERRKLDLASYITGREEEEFFICTVNASELLQGVWRAADEAVRARRSAFVETIIRRFPVLPVSLRDARVHARLCVDLQQKGLSIGVNDSWIAAICISRNLTLATGNLREFQRVPDLEVEHWSP